MTICEVCDKATDKRKRGYNKYEGKMCCPSCYDKCSGYQELAEMILGNGE